MSGRPRSDRLRRAWADLPAWARWVLAVYLIGFAQGTAAHIRDLTRGGIHAYSTLPQAWIQVFSVSLVLLDPLVVVLAAFVRVRFVITLPLLRVIKD